MSEKDLTEKLESFGSLTIASSPATNVIKAPPISPQERELAQAASQEYNKNNYAQCLASLTKLEALRPKDHKLTLNKAIVQFHQSGQKDTEAVAAILTTVATQVKEEEGDIQSFLLYNQSLIAFRNGQLTLALTHLLKAFNHIESMGKTQPALLVLVRLVTFLYPSDEALSQRVSLLLLEVLLGVGQPQKALALLSYVETQLLGPPAAQSSPLTGSSGSTSSLLHDKNPMLGASLRHKKTLQEPISSRPLVEPPPTPAPCLIDPEWLRGKLVSLRARASLQAGMLKSGKKDVKTLLGMSKPAFNTTSLMLKSHLDYLRGNFNKSARMLGNVTPPDGMEAGQSPGLLWFNNSACSHFRAGRHLLAIRYLTRAMEEAHEKLAHSQDSFLGMTKAQLSMNLGIVLLHTGQPEAAFHHLMKATRYYPCNPRLWLRLAECCINVKQNSNGPAYDQDRVPDILKKTISCTSGRKLILSSNLSSSKTNGGEKYSSLNPTLSLEFASLCLRNALLMLRPSPTQPEGLGTGATQNPSSLKQSTLSPGDSSDNGGSPPSVAPAVSGVATLQETLNTSANNPPCNPSTPSTDTQAEQLQASILATSAYVNLCLREPILAVEHSKALLALPNLAGAYRLLGQLYAAEGLLQLDQISEAIELLQPDTLPDDLSLCIPEPTSSERELSSEPSIPPMQAPWEPTSLRTAKATMLYNLAVAYAIRGNLDKASETIALVWSCKTDGGKVPIHLIMLSVYIELQQGHVQNARNILIKHGLPQPQQ